MDQKESKKDTSKGALAETAKASSLEAPLKRVHKPHTLRWYLGMLVSSVFTMTYMIAPLYMLVALILLLFRIPSLTTALWIASPILLSIAVPPIASPWVIENVLPPLLDYFDYEEIIEDKPIDGRQNMLDGTHNYILAVQPHGVVSMVGICSSVSLATHPVYRSQGIHGTLPTAVASAVLHTPILKHVMGIFGLISASKSSMTKHLSKTGRGPAGSVVLYVGGMAELFLSSRKKESLYLKNRKGFIKLALQQPEHVDIVPIYLFGNTSVLSVLKLGKLLGTLSRKMQVSMTYFWGKAYLPIPRDEKILYVAGQPLGIPHIAEPTQEDIDKWHAKYCNEVTRLFNTYKERVPAYKHKTLVFV